MPQPDQSNSSRPLIFIGLAALLLLVSAAVALIAGGGGLTIIAGVLALVALVPLALLYIALRSSSDEARSQARARTAATKVEFFTLVRGED